MKTKIIRITPPAPPIGIRLEVELSLPSGGTGVYPMETPCDGEILNWSEARQIAFVRRTWKCSPKKKGDRLIAFHLPVTTWKRIEV